MAKAGAYHTEWLIALAVGFCAAVARGGEAPAPPAGEVPHTPEAAQLAQDLLAKAHHAYHSLADTKAVGIEAIYGVEVSGTKVGRIVLTWTQGAARPDLTLGVTEDSKPLVTTGAAGLDPVSLLFPQGYCAGMFAARAGDGYVLEFPFEVPPGGPAGAGKGRLTISVDLARVRNVEEFPGGKRLEAVSEAVPAEGKLFLRTLAISQSGPPKTKIEMLFTYTHREGATLLRRVNASTAALADPVPTPIPIALWLEGVTFGKPEPPKPAPPEPDVVQITSDEAPIASGGQVIAKVPKGRAFGVLERAGDQLLVTVCTGTKVRTGWLDARHGKFLTDDDVDLAAGWLKLCKLLKPELDIPATQRKLDGLVDRVAAAMASGKTPREKARLMGYHLFFREGFTYAHKDVGVWPFDEVLDAKKGVCFDFSMLYAAVARKLKMPIHVVGAPDHMFIRYDDGHGDRFNMEATDDGKIHDGNEYLIWHLQPWRAKRTGGSQLRSLSNPRAVSALLARCAAALTEYHKHDQARELYPLAVEIDPGRENIRSDWGVLMTNLGRYADACELFAKQVEIFPRDYRAWAGWAGAPGNLGRHAEAAAKCEQAVAVNPSNEGADYGYRNWAEALSALGKYAEACEKFDKATRINPKLASHYTGWAAALIKLGKYAEACRVCEKAVDLDAKYARPYLQWGIALRKLGKRVEGDSVLDKTVRLDPALADEVARARKED